jgi:integrase/recombinase XerD
MISLRRAVLEYIEMRRSLGFGLRRVAPRLLNFVSFMEKRNATYITVELALQWAKQPPHASPATWAQHLSFVRIFARYRSATDSRTEIPPAALLPFRPKRRRPHIYTDEEIRRLLHAALNLPKIGLRPITFYCFIGLLSVSGLRVGEAQNLKLHDVDLESGILTIRGAKFGKDRLVPLHPSACGALKSYLKQRERLWQCRSAAPNLFLSSIGNPLDGADIRRTFHELSRQSGLRSPTASKGPRLHDFRHSFASRSLLRWYQEGKDPERQLPLLSTYLGHVGWNNTYWYLSSQPELMREAMVRLDGRWEKGK